MPDMPTISTIDFGDGVERQLAGGVNTNFTGHKSVWDAMTDEQRAQYDTYDFDDDFNGMPIDAVPTQGSTNPVQSGGVYSAIDTLTNQDSDMLNILGAKNVLPNNATTQVINGVTFTVNSDGSITVSGTATAETWYYVTDYVPIAWSNNSFLFSGRGTASTNINYFVAVYDSSMTFLREYRNNTQGTDTIIAQSSDASYMRVDIVVPNGATVSGTFYPMIRPASIKDDTYVPYAMTNRELTESGQGVNLLRQGSAAFDTTYNVDTNGYGLLVLWLNQAGWRDSICVPRALFNGAYRMSIGGYDNSVRVDLTNSSIKVTKLNSSIGNNFDMQVWAYK